MKFLTIGPHWGFRTPVLFFLLFLSTHAAQSAPKIAVDERVHDYGVLYLGEVQSVSHTFVLMNEGDEPLVITGTHPSCGCTRADLSGQVIPPGGVETLTAELGFEKYTGKDQVRVTVTSNDPQTPSLDLGMQGYVIEKWKIEPTELNAGVVVASSTSGLMLVKVAAQSRMEDPEWNLMEAKADPQRLRVHLLNHVDRTVKNRYREKTWQYEVRVRSGTQFSEHESENIVFLTNSPESATMTLPVRWKVEADLEVTPRKLGLTKSRYFNLHRPGNSTEETGLVRVRSRTSTPVEVTKIVATPPFSAKQIPGNRVGEALVEIGIATEEPGSYSGVVTLFTDRPNENQFDILLMGSVELQKPIASIATNFHHFGSVFPDRIPEVSQVFEIRNSGTRPLELFLESAEGMQAFLADARVLPGSGTTLFLRKDLRNLVGPVLDQAVLRTNDNERARIEFRIQGEVLPYWQLEPAEVVFPDSVEGKSGVAQVVLEQWFQSWEKPNEPIPFSAEGPKAVIEVGKTTTAYSGLGFATAETEITVRLQPEGQVGWNEAEIELRFATDTHQSVPPLRLRWELLGQLRSLPRRLVFTGPRSGTNSDVKKDVKVYSLDGSKFKIESVEAPPGIQVESLGTESDASLYRVEVIDSKLLASTVEPKISFKTNLSREPELRVEVLFR